MIDHNKQQSMFPSHLKSVAGFCTLENCGVPKSVGLPADAEADEGLLKDVEFYALDSRQESILWDVQPVFVVVYDPDVTFVRQLEVRHHVCCLMPMLYKASAIPSTEAVLLGMQIYQAEHPDWRVRVYNLLYEDSQEADKFSEAVAREVSPTCDMLAQSCHGCYALKTAQTKSLLHLRCCIAWFPKVQDSI